MLDDLKCLDNKVLNKKVLLRTWAYTYESDKDDDDGSKKDEDVGVA